MLSLGVDIDVRIFLGQHPDRVSVCRSEYVKASPRTAPRLTSPLDQFEIRILLSVDAPILANLHISLTNIGLYLTIAAFLVLTLNLLATNYNKVIANN